MLSEPSLTREKSDQSGLDWRSPFESLLSFRLLRLVLELRVPCLCDLGREGGREEGGREGESKLRQIKNLNKNKKVTHFPENLPEDLMPPPETDNL